MQKTIHNVTRVFDELKVHYKLNTYRELAAFLDVKEGTLNAWKARNRIGDIDAILNKCEGLSYEWVKTGDGDMFRNMEGKEQAILNANTNKPQSTEVALFFSGMPEQSTNSVPIENNNYRNVFSINRDLCRLLKYYIQSRGILSLTIAKTLQLDFFDLQKIINGSEYPAFYIKERIIELLIQEHILAQDGTIADPKAFDALEVSQGEVDSLFRNDTSDQGLKAEYVRVARNEIPANDDGRATIHSEQIVDHLAFRSGWLKHSLGLSPENIAIITIIDDSMEPYLVESDLILIDLSIVRIEGNSVYVLQSGDSLIVRRVQVKLDGGVTVKSDNPRYEPETYNRESAEDLRVVGRMVRRLVK